ncbi:MAG: hypothetical protein ACI8ZM_004317 [Crocinitomix sp.]|jgi:hypothetical protein
MKNSKTIILTIGVLIASVSFTSCNKIKSDTKITVTNTLQTEAGTGGVELPIETIFVAPEGSLAADAALSDAIEFKTFLGLYDIDLSKNTIIFNLVATADDPTYSPFYRTLEAGTFDRYYFKFDQDHKIKSGESTDASTSLKVISDSEILVQIGEGYSYNPETTFTITLK